MPFKPGAVRKERTSFFSSRWDKSWQIFDHYWTPKNIEKWWLSETWEFVFIGEVPFDIAENMFVWEHAAKTMSMKQLRSKLFWKKQRALRG